MNPSMTTDNSLAVASKSSCTKGRITIALLWPNYGGGVTSVNDLAVRLDKERFNVIFIFLSGCGAEKNAIEKAGHEVFYLSNIELLNAFRFSILFKLIRILRQHNVDIIHCQRHKATVYGTIAAKIARTPVVLAHVHGLNRSKKNRRKLINLIVLRWVNKIITVSKAVGNDVLNNNPVLRPEQVICLNNSIDYKRFAEVSVDTQQIRADIGVSSDSFVFGTVGRLAPTKGLSHLIQAFVKLKKEVANSELIIIGDGRLKDKLHAEAAETGVGASIHFLGYRKDVEKLLSVMDVFVMASVAEGMPGALLEAMAAGVPCIGTNVGGIPEILANGEYGYIVPPKNVNLLSEAMINLAKETAQSKETLTQKARKKIIDEYGHNVVIKTLEKIYEAEYKAAKQGN